MGEQEHAAGKVIVSHPHSLTFLLLDMPLDQRMIDFRGPLTAA
jgi:hypothetical protein